jgi:hypothetical protein
MIRKLQMEDQCAWQSFKPISLWKTSHMYSDKNRTVI